MWLYSAEYPSNWYSFPVHAGPDLETDKSFSNENTSPEGMDGDGVFVTITVDSTGSKPCAPGPGGNDPRIGTSQILIDKETSTEYLYVNGSVGVIVLHANWCYRFSFLTSSTQTRDKYKPEIDHMLSSFKFNR
jgi:hypothetical protein